MSSGAGSSGTRIISLFQPRRRSAELSEKGDVITGTGGATRDVGAPI